MLVPAMLTLLQCAGGECEQRNLVSSVVSIAQRNFLPNQTLLISSTGYEDIVVSLLLGYINAMTTWSVHVARPDVSAVSTTHNDHNAIGSYVILVRDAEDLQQQREELEFRMAWSNQARFLVVVTERVEDSPSLMALSIVQDLWNRGRVLQVVVLVQYQLYTWFPYEHCSTSKEIVRVDEWSNLFPDKTLTRRHGCELTVAITQVVPHVIARGNNSWGLESEYLHLLQHALNFTVSYRTPAPGSSHETHMEMVNDLLIGLADVILGDFPLHLVLV